MRLELVVLVRHLPVLLVPVEMLTSATQLQIVRPSLVVRLLLVRRVALEVQ